MITKDQFELAINSKLGYLTKYYSMKWSKIPSEVYSKLLETFTVKTLKEKKSRLFLEDISLVIEALDIEFEEGVDKSKDFLYHNIGG